MIVFRNILITFGLFFGALIAAFVLENGLGDGKDLHGAIKGMQGLLIFSTATWAAISSNRLEMRKFQTSLSYSPVAIFIAILLLWIVVFPWFLTVRYQVKHGLVAFKPEFNDGNDGGSSFQSPLSRSSMPTKLYTIPPLPGAGALSNGLGANSGPSLDQLEKLAALKDRGILTEAEFVAEKRKILGS